MKELQIKKWDWLLIFGAVLAPMTGFRIWKIGPAELLCFFWSLKYINLKKIKLNFLSKYFLIFFFSMVIGTLICLVINPKECVVDQLLTWIFLIIISCTLYEQLLKNNIDYNVKLFDSICKISTIWYSFLYVYSLTISKSLFGVPIWYSNIRFAGCGTNPHQVAVLTCGIACWYLYRFFETREIINVPLFIFTVFLLSETKSSTGKAAIVLACLVYFTITFLLIVPTKRKKIAITSVFVMVFALSIVFFWDKLYEMSYEWVSEDANGLGRFNIWSSFANCIIKSPIFGLGPGIHAKSGTIEFHNSYLEIFAATGIVGFGAFIVFTIMTAKKIVNGNVKLLPVMIALYGYSMAGFACRRLVYWVVLIFIIVICEKTDITTENKKSDLLQSIINDNIKT